VEIGILWIFLPFIYTLHNTYVSELMIEYCISLHAWIVDFPYRISIHLFQIIWFLMVFWELLLGSFVVFRTLFNLWTLFVNNGSTLYAKSVYLCLNYEDSIMWKSIFFRSVDGLSFFLCWMALQELWTEERY